MEYIINSIVNNCRYKISKTLSDEFEEDLNEFLTYLDKKNSFTSRNNTISKEHRCNARVWDRNLAQLGLEKQCSRKKIVKTDFCMFHNQKIIEDKKKCLDCSKLHNNDIYHEYQWEHHGVINGNKPLFFNVEQDKYESKYKVKINVELDSDSDSDSDVIESDTETKCDSDKETNTILEKNLKSLLKNNDMRFEEDDDEEEEEDITLY